ncbi:MAG: methionyl-tRNA formyltransferase [Spirochaetaceae bacterium]|nr:MAG: methionyl-tRNA formyltransferase [Spirochaetaceae bacterium]
MRILFAGTPEIALPSLQALRVAPPPPDAAAGAEYARPEVVAVLTAPDAPAGRGREILPPPVKVQAEAWGLPVLQPARLDGGARRAVAEFRPDLLVVVAYGKIFGPRFLELFPRGGVNVHPSLLPRHRGPSPIPAAILAGDGRTGVTVQRLALEMDAGDILAQREIPLPSGITARELEEKLGRIGAEILVDTVNRIAMGQEKAVPQDPRLATWCHLIGKEEGTLAWDEDAARIERMIRAYTPWPGVRCSWNGKTLQLLEASVPAGPEDRPDVTPGTVLGVDNKAGILVQTVNGVLAVRRLKLHARKEMDFRAFLNGNSSIIGSVLEQA